MQRSPRTSLLLARTALLASTVVHLAAQSVLADHAQTVLVSGEFAPGFPAGATIGTAPIFGGTIDRSGALLFKARITQNAGLGIDASNDAAYYFGHGGADLQMVVRAGTQAPGCPVGTLLRNNTATPSNGLTGVPRLSPVGSTLFFRSNLYDPVTPANTPTNADTALFWGQPNALQLLVREGDFVPFLPNGERWGDLQFAHTTHHVNGNGDVVFQNVLRSGAGGVNGNNDSMLVFGQPGTLQLALREGSPWPGSANGETLGPIGTQVQMSLAGIVLHPVVLQVGTGVVQVTAANDKALALWVGGNTFVVAREGDAAPGLPAGTVFSDVSPTVAFHATSACAINQGGTVVFRAHLAGGGTVQGVDDSSVWIGGLGGLGKVFRTGEQAPGLAPGVLFGTVADDSMQIDDANRVVFSTTLTGAVTAGNDSAVWYGPATAPTVLAREGERVPAMVASANGPWRYGDLSISTRAMLDGSGGVILPVQATDGVDTRIVWLGSLTSGLVQLLIDDTEVWATNLGSSSQEVAGFVSIASNSDSTPSWMNRNGDFCLLMTLPSTPTNLGSAIVRGHLGSMQAEPSAVPASGGFTQFFTFDVGPAQANHFYFVLASSLGTDIGFPSPLGPQQIPLNFDNEWTLLSYGAANSVVWGNTFGQLDAQGRGIGLSGFTMPPGFLGFEGTILHHAAVILDPTFSTSTFVTEPVVLKLY